MEPGLERLNSLPTNEAEAEFGKCCGSTNWARRMAAECPFASSNQLMTMADRVWWSLEPEDWLEAFAGHPKIGEHKAARAPTLNLNLATQEKSGLSMRR